MAQERSIVYQTPPLAGRPPFATDDDSVYDKQPQPAHTKRIRQPPPPNPNARTSAYNVYAHHPARCRMSIYSRPLDTTTTWRAVTEIQE